MGKLIKNLSHLNQINISIGKPGINQMAIFAKQLAVMIKTGLPITEALEIAADSASGSLKKTLKKVSESVQSGNSLSESFEEFPQIFSNLFISTTKAGELSGTLEETLKNLALQLDKEKNLISKVKGAMYYPAIVLTASIVLGVVVAFSVLPKLVPLFTQFKVELPITTKALLWIARAFQTSGIQIVLGLIIGSILLFWLIRQRFLSPITHWLILHAPIVGKLIKQVSLARFCHTLGTLLRSGLNVVEAFKATQQTLGNYYYQNAVKKIAWHVGRGGKISNSIEQFDTLFPKIVVRMVTVGEKSGQLEETLDYLGDYYEEEVDISVKSFSSTIEPVLLFVIGLIVAFLALAIITPIYELTGSVRR